MLLPDHFCLIYYPKILKSFLSQGRVKNNHDPWRKHTAAWAGKASCTCWDARGFTDLNAYTVLPVWLFPEKEYRAETIMQAKEAEISSNTHPDDSDKQRFRNAVNKTEFIIHCFLIGISLGLRCVMFSRWGIILTAWQLRIQTEIITSLLSAALRTRRFSLQHHVAY